MQLKFIQKLNSINNRWDLVLFLNTTKILLEKWIFKIKWIEMGYVNLKNDNDFNKTVDSYFIPLGANSWRYTVYM